MKIGVSAYSFSNYLNKNKTGYRDIIRIAKEIGFTGIDFVDLVNPEWGTTESEETLAKEVRLLCDEYGMDIPAYTISANFLGSDPDAEVERICRKLDIAKILRAPVLRHDASFSLRDKEGYTWEDGIAEMAPRIRRVAEYGASLGIKTCSENHGYIYQAPERVKKLIDTVNHPNYGWLVDIGNFTVVDADNLSSVKIGAPYAFHVHAKDFVCKKAPAEGMPVPQGFAKSSHGNLWRGTVLGHGEVDVVGCLKAIADTGYNGYVSLEFEGPEDNISALKQGFSYLSQCVGK